MRNALSGAPIEVRGVQTGDIDRIVAIERESFGDPWSREAFQTFADRVPALFFSAYTKGESERVVGYSVTMRVGPEAELLNIAVDPEWRGKGVARQLLGHLLAVLDADNVELLFLEVRESNHRARRLYEASGFSEVGRRRRYYRKPVEDALILRRSVREASGLEAMQSNDTHRN